MKLLRVRGSKNNIEALGDYLRADGPFEGKNDNFDPVPRLKINKWSTAKCRNFLT
jgi:hypothetical protein